ncbi:uncharacterized protein F4812DRAFT_441664 [Daldinia caldariorum]|uniref:uncharacterized protein n=1 Tax=Daldinia caldariorum TaxID=326644 RepID=UPI002007CAC2|nr:uncharacterized protein F4812DRAFT_441664 [Daldinia caldariorum]KAI1464702.1 hypothetical protein F4812DRAFT_441664 [Daldinia caldariorum]
MRQRNVINKTLRWHFTFTKNTNPHVVVLPKFHGPLKSVFAKAPLPVALFRKPNLSVLRASPRDRKYGAQFLLLERSPPQQRLELLRGVRMLNYVQTITTPTADTHGTCLLLHFDNKRYIIGSIAEGTQRAAIQRNIGIHKVEDVFVTGVVNWYNAGGLLGFILVLADTLISKVEMLKQNIGERKVKPHALSEATMPRLRIHGGKNVTQLLATARRFIFRRGLPLDPQEILEDPRLIEQQELKPDWEDSNVKVWYMPVQSTTTMSSSPRKRTHSEFIEADGSDEQQDTTDPEEDRKLVQTVVTQMFDSDWKMDALVETTLHEAKLPAKLFVRDDKGHIQVYTGPLPGSGQEVPDIPVLVRQPWPGAMVQSLPRTKPSTQSMCYIFKTHERRGKFNPQVAEKHGVAKHDYKKLVAGENVVGQDGVVVTPDMVLAESVPGNGFAVVDLPDPSYIDALVNRTEWSNDSLMNGIHVIYWILGRGVINDPRLQEFMQRKRKSEIKHIVSSPDTCANRIVFDSVTAQTFKLRCIDPDRFYLPVFDNAVSISNTSTKEPSPIYEGSKLGKVVQFAPQYVHQDNKIFPFPDIEKMASVDLNDEILEMAQRAKERATDPEFLAKIEKVESDIPNRDAEIIPLGTGSALPSKYRNVSSTFLRVPGYGNYLFDCGENTLGQLHRVFGKELPEVLRNLKGIWISHLHADHHLGTASVIKAWHEATTQSDPSARLLIASHTHMIDWLREYSDIEDFGFNRLETVIFGKWNPVNGGPEGKILRPREFSEEETRAFGLKQIDACYVQHCFGAMATVFTFPTGFKVAYSGDCRPSNDFVRIGKGATLLIHESTFEDELRGDAIAKKHSTMSEAIAVGRRMGTRRILLTHFSQRYQKIPIIEENMEIRPDASGSGRVGFDEVVLFAFDYMRVRLGDFRKAQVFLPTLQKLFEEVVKKEEEDGIKEDE